MIRQMGITRVMGRTAGMSTSELIKRVQKYVESGTLRNKQQDEWDKVVLEMK